MRPCLPPLRCGYRDCIRDILTPQSIPNIGAAAEVCPTVRTSRYIKPFSLNIASFSLLPFTLYPQINSKNVWKTRSSYRHQGRWPRVHPSSPGRERHHSRLPLHPHKDRVPRIHHIWFLQDWGWSWASCSIQLWGDQVCLEWSNRRFGK